MSMENLIDPTNLISAKELGRVMQVSAQTVNRLAKEGKIPGFKFGGGWRFSQLMLKEWFTRQMMNNIHAPFNTPPEERDY